MFEDIIFSNLLNNEDYTRKILPYLKKEYFSSRRDEILYSVIDEYIQKYNSIPSIEALKIEVSSIDNINEEMYYEINEYVSKLKRDDKTDQKWLFEQTEKFCRDKAIYNAIRASIKILEGGDAKNEKGAIPSLLEEALSITFDNSIGHDYDFDSEERWEFYHKVEEKVPFDLQHFNEITKGGLSRKTLSIIMAGCVHPETKIKIQYNSIEKEVSIGEVKGLLENGYTVEVSSPDGWVNVNEFVNKGNYIEYIVQTLSGNIIVRCNENHLFETPNGWVSANDAVEKYGGYIEILTEDNIFLTFNIIKTENIIPIVDIQVEHENHRYYTNGLSSHNTNVGKSMVMCHMAASNYIAGKNVLYITMEMAEERISERIDMNLLNVTSDELALMSKEQFKRRIGKLKEKVTGKLIVKEYPTSGAGSATFRALLNDLRLKKNFIPDIIYIDYLNICMSSRLKMGANVNSYTYIKTIAEELRGLAVEFNVPIVSATQSNREGSASSDPEIQNVSESWGLPATVDFMFVLITDEEMAKLNQLMVKQLKNRYDHISKLPRFVIGVDYDHMKLYDIEVRKSNANSVSSGEAYIDPDTGEIFELDTIKIGTPAKDRFKGLF